MTKKESIEFNVFGDRAFRKNFHEEANYKNLHKLKSSKNEKYNKRLWSCVFMNSLIYGDTGGSEIYTLSLTSQFVPVRYAELIF